jgi:peroxiredoxin
MNRIITLLALSFVAFPLVHAGGYQVGDRASDFRLQNIDGDYVSLSDFPKAKGFIVVFTCNGCPYAQAYQDRIIELDRKYKARGYPVVAINPNDTDLKPEDSLEGMKVRAREKGYTFPYLKDADYKVFREYGATRTPHVFVLTKQEGSLVVSYIGAIDDNYQDAAAVKEPYLANALDALLAGREPDPGFTKAIGCTIKQK